MSRIGKLPIPLLDGVKVVIADGQVQVTGPKGSLEQAFDSKITVEQADNELRVARPDDSPDSRSKHGLVRSLIQNMIKGVTDGYERILEIHGVGYRATMKGKSLTLSVGHSHPVVIEPPAGIEYSVDGTTTIKVSGIDKQLVGQAAADVRAWRKPEPYKGKGIRYRDEHVRRKVGKAGAK